MTDQKGTGADHKGADKKAGKKPRKDNRAQHKGAGGGKPEQGRQGRERVARGQSAQDKSVQHKGGQGAQDKSRPDKSAHDKANQQKTPQSQPAQPAKPAREDKAGADKPAAGKPAAKVGDAKPAAQAGAGDQDSAVQREQAGRQDSAKTTPPKSTATRSTASAAASGGTGGTSAGTPPAGSGGEPPRKGGKGALVVAIIALLIAVLALLGAAWLWYHDQQQAAVFEQQAEAVDKQVEQMQSALESSGRVDVKGEIENTLKQQLQPQLEKFDKRLDQLQSNLDQAGEKRQQALSELRDNLQQAQSRLAEVQQSRHGLMQKWQLNQIEHLLVVANRRLQLYGQPEQAEKALELANNAIAQIDDPRLFAVRKQIIDEIAALEALPSPDIEGVALQLSTFIDQIEQGLPLASDVPQDYQADDKAGTSGEDGFDLGESWDQFRDSMASALQRLVTIQRGDGSRSAALLPPDQVYFLNQNLMLELRSARLALLEGNAQQYRSSLKAARSWLQQYFDTSNDAVAAMIDRLKKMQNVKLDWNAPDISGSLEKLRDYMAEQSQDGGVEAANAEQGGAAAQDQNSTAVDNQQDSK